MARIKDVDVSGSLSHCRCARCQGVTPDDVGDDPHDPANLLLLEALATPHEEPDPDVESMEVTVKVLLTRSEVVRLVESGGWTPGRLLQEITRLCAG